MSSPISAALMAKATPLRSGDRLAGIAAESAEEGMAARWCLSEVPLSEILAKPLIPYEEDDVTRLILDTHDAVAFREIAHLTVGDFREFLIKASSETLTRISPGITPEIAAAVSKIMRHQDLILVARKCRVVTKFRNTIGLPGRLSVRLQPNHPTDDAAGITAAIVDGLSYGCGDAVIGLNPASDSVSTLSGLLHLFDDLIQRLAIPTQGCILTHVTTTLEAMNRGLPVDLVFQSIAGTQKANASFGVTLPDPEGGARGGACPETRHGGRQLHVFRDRAGLGTLGQCPSRHRPADPGGTGLRRRASVPAAPRQHCGGLHRAGISL